MTIMRRHNRPRPTSEQRYAHDMPKRAHQLCLLGLRDTDLALAFGVTLSLLEKWKREHTKLFKAILAGRDAADGHVARALYHRARGYSHPDVDIRVVQGQIVQTPVIKHYPPDTLACMFWLKNRHNKLWRDIARQEHTGRDGGPIDVKRPPINLQGCTEEEIEFAARIGLKRGRNGGAVAAEASEGEFYPPPDLLEQDAPK